MDIHDSNQRSRKRPASSVSGRIRCRSYTRRPACAAYRIVICLALLLPGWASDTRPASAAGDSSLEVEIVAKRLLIQTGQPVWVDFLIRNRSDESITLIVAELPVAEERPIAMGLPVEHIFSGEPGQSVGVRLEPDAKPLRVSTPGLPTAGRSVVIAPHGTIGAQLDLARYCEMLRRPGTYEIQWRPYQGALQSNKLRLVVAPLRQAVIHTDFGRMTVRLNYDQAPHHVENFLELAERGFYDGLTFHRVVHGGLIQGGCPRGDGTGVRPDGKLLEAEITDLPIDVGSVVMATARNDPDSGSSQFYIALTRLRSLEGKQTVFGHLVGDESFETLRKLGSVPTGDQDRPIKPVYIRNISLENVPLDEGTRFGGSSTRPGAGSGSGRRGPGAAPGIGPSSGVKRTESPTTMPSTPPAVRFSGEATAVKAGSR